MGNSQEGGILMGPNVIIGGSNNFNHLADSTNSSVLGGVCNKIVGNFTSIGGGVRNTASAGCAFIGGGYLNPNCANCSAIVGGCGNIVWDGS